MGLETIVATIYADKQEQLTALGFKPEYIREERHTWNGVTTTHYEISAEFAPFDDEPMKSAMDFLARAKNSKGKNRRGLDTDWHYRNDYSQCYD